MQWGEMSRVIRSALLKDVAVVVWLKDVAVVVWLVDSKSALGSWMPLLFQFFPQWKDFKKKFIPVLKVFIYQEQSIQQNQ